MALNHARLPIPPLRRSRRKYRNSRCQSRLDGLWTIGAACYPSTRYQSSMFQVYPACVGLCLNPPISSAQTAAVTGRAIERVENGIDGEDVLDLLDEHGQLLRIDRRIHLIARSSEACRRFVGIGALG